MKESYTKSWQWIGLYLTTGACCLALALAAKADTGYAPDEGRSEFVLERPEGLVVVGTATSSLALAWTDLSANETGFVVERMGGANGMWIQVGVVGGNVTNYTDSGLTPGTWYSYRVRAMNRSVFSSYGTETRACTRPEEQAVSPLLGQSWPGFIRGSAEGLFVAGDFVYVTLGEHGLVVIDASNPEAMCVVGGMDTAGRAGDVYVQGSRAYVAVSGQGLLILDVRDPTRPVATGCYASITDPSSIFVLNGVAYVGRSAGGIELVDVSNPAIPTRLGSASAEGSALGLYVVSNVAYVAADGSGIQLFNVSNPAMPTLAFQTNVNDDFAVDLFVLNNILYAAFDGDGLRLFDVSKPLEARVLGGVSGWFTTYGVHVGDDVAYLAVGSDGVAVIDVSMATQPVHRFTYNTAGKAMSSRLLGSTLLVADGDVVERAGEGIVALNAASGTNLVALGGVVTSGSCESLQVTERLVYLADGAAGLRILRAEADGTPRLVGGYTTNCVVMDVAVIGNVAYMATYGAGFLVVDVSEPTRPFLIGQCEASANLHAVEIQGAYAYVVDHDLAGLSVIDIATPFQPARVGQLKTGTFAFDVAVHGSFAYLAQGGGVRIINVENPREPRKTGEYPDITTDTYYGIKVAGDYAFVAANGGLKIFDIANRSNLWMSVLAEVDTWGARSVVLAGDRAFVSGAKGGGIAAVNVADPAHPFWEGSYASLSFGAGCDTLDGGSLWVADREAGLRRMDISAQTPVTRASDGTHFDRIRVEWSGDLHATGYEVLRSTNSVLKDAARIATTAVTNVFDDTNIVAGVYHYYWVRAITGSVSGAAGNMAVGLAGSVRSLAVTAEYTEGEISIGGEVDWYRFHLSEPGEYCVETELFGLSDNYLVLYGPDNQHAEAWRKDDGAVGKAATLVADLLAGMYYAKVRGYSVSQTGGYKIRLTSVQMTAPTGIWAQASSADSVRVGWCDATANETGFEVERRVISTGAWSVVKQVGPNVTNYLDWGLMQGTPYAYRVRAVHESRRSSYSAEAGVTTLNPPNMPAGLRKTPVCNNAVMHVRWEDRSENESFFDIEHKSGFFGEWSLLATVPSGITNYSHTGVDSGRHYYRVRAVNGDGYSGYLYEVGFNNAPSTRVAQRVIWLESMDLPAVLDASSSSDEDGGDRLLYSWRESASNPVLGLIPVGADYLPVWRVSFSAPGVYDFSVRTSDGLDFSGNTETIRVHVPGVSGYVDLDTSEGLARVPDARISAHPTVGDADSNRAPVSVAISDSMGRYELHGLRFGIDGVSTTYHVRAERGGFETRVKAVAVGGTADHSMPRGLRPGELIGIVRNEREESIPNAQVAITGMGHDRLFALTGRDGRFAFDRVPYGTCLLRLSASGYRSEIRELSVGPGLGELSIHLQSSGAALALLDIMVVQAGSGVPLSNARVSFGNGLVDATTDHSGWAARRIVETGAYLITVTRGDHQPVRLPYFEVAPGTNVLKVSMTPLRASVIEGEVLDVISGRPIGAAVAGVKTTAGLEAQSDVTDSVGYFKIANVPAGEHQLRFAAAGYQTRMISISNPTNLYLRVYLGRSVAWRPPVKVATHAALFTRVATSQVFLADMAQSVTLDASSSTGEGLGYLWRESPENPCFGLLPANPEGLAVIQVSGFRIPGVYRFEVQAMSGRNLSRNREIISVYVPGLSGNVHVSPSDGVLGIPQVTVRAYSRYLDALAWNGAYADSKTTLADPAGHFALDGLSEGSYWLVAKAPQGGGMTDYGPILRCVSSASGARSLNVNMATAPCDLAGFVCDTSNRPLENVRVVISVGSIAESCRTTTDARGIFRFDGAPGGTWLLLFTKRGYRTVAVPLSLFQGRSPYRGRIEQLNAGPDAMGIGSLQSDAGGLPRVALSEDSQVVSLTGRITVNYKGLALPVGEAEVVLAGGFARGFTDVDGRYTIRGLPRGNYFAVARKVGYIPTALGSGLQPLSLVDSVNVRDIVMRFNGPGPVIRGTVVGQDGSPEWNAAVEAVAATGTALFGRAVLSVSSDERGLCSSAPVTNDAGGVFQMEGLAEGLRSIRVRLNDGRSFVTNLWVDGCSEMRIVSPFEPAQTITNIYETWWTNYFLDEECSAYDNDVDRDGRDNWHEFIAGSDPTQAGSAFLCSIRVDSVTRMPTLGLSSTLTNRNYELEWRTNLNSDVWHPLGAAGFLVPGQPLSVPLTGLVNKVYMRARVRLP